MGILYMKRCTLIVIVVLNSSKLCSTSVDLLCENAVMTLKSPFFISVQSQHSCTSSLPD